MFFYFKISEYVVRVSFFTVGKPVHIYITFDEVWLTFFHYLLGPRRHLSVRASSDTVFLPAPTLSSVLPPFLALLSQELPP